MTPVTPVTDGEAVNPTKRNETNPGLMIHCLHSSAGPIEMEMAQAQAQESISV